MADLSLFEKNGGIFLTPVEELQRRMVLVRAFVFDWDGVFTDSRKSGPGQSYFMEVDSMGINLLRYSTWLAREKQLPYTAVMSGEDNETAKFFMQREHFDAGYFKAKDKKIALEHFTSAHKIDPHHIAFVFDDVLDLSVAEAAGLRICVNRKSNPLFIDYVKKNRLADYITGEECGGFPLREACELMTGLNGNFNEVLRDRIAYDGDYAEYLAARNKAETAFYSLANNQLAVLE